jgi:hypothetical protein
MTGFPLQDLPPEVEVQLSHRLATWAEARRIDDAQLQTIRASALAVVTAETEASTLDVDWLWSLLRPASALVERGARLGEAELPARFERWLAPVLEGIDDPRRAYVRLA